MLNILAIFLLWFSARAIVRQWPSWAVAIATISLSVPLAVTISTALALTVTNNLERAMMTGMAYGLVFLPFVSVTVIWNTARPPPKPPAYKKPKRRAMWDD